MLTELNIKNYALIDSLDIEFRKGMNVLTGETGAGKSIIIEALSLLLGEKVSGSVVRKYSPRCEIIGLFDITKNASAKKQLKSLSLQNDSDEDALFLRRQIDPQNKSKSFINDKPVNLSTLSELGDFLIDIHGQHEHQLLLKPTEQKNLLDRYAKNDALREEIENLYGAWKDYIAELQSSQLSTQEKNQRIDLYSFQVNEIDSAKLTVGEEEELERILPQLKNAERLRGLSDDVFSHLYDSEGSVLERLHKSQKLLESIQNVGIDLKESPVLLEESLIRIKEIVNSIDSFRKTLVSDPQKLDQIISRQDLISKLKKKYGQTIPQILEYREKIDQELKRLESHEESVQELEKKIESAYTSLIKQCKKLSASRKKYAEKMSTIVEKELKDLGFHKARFVVQLLPEKDENGKDLPTMTGLEKVEFLFSANPGEEPNPLKSVASGGELSRVTLALKKILSEADLVPTLIFDEVDSGIGGSMGNVIGEKLKDLSKSHQTLLITHLPQIAAFADLHLSVTKAVEKQKTKVIVETVEKEKRTKEIARMLGGTSGNGEDPTPASLKHATELLNNAAG